MVAMTYTLVLLRHGESEWNAKNLFTGWVDVPLSDKGRGEATRGGELLKEKGVSPDVVHTSLLRRAINTANLALDAADLLWIPVKRSWRLNERHYGALQGMDKKKAREEFGDEKFTEYRRSYDVPPPAIELGTEWSQDADPRYAGEPIPRARHWPRSWSGPCRTSRARSSPTSRPARPSWWPRTATRCVPSSSTWTT